MSSESSFSVQKDGTYDRLPAGSDESRPVASQTAYETPLSPIRTDGASLVPDNVESSDSESDTELVSSGAAAGSTVVGEIGAGGERLSADNVISTTMTLDVFQDHNDVGEAAQSVGPASSDAATVVASESPVAGNSSGSGGSSRVLDDGLTPGSMFGQFRIVRYVGGGGMGHVYEGFDCDLERTVAIKVLPRRKASDEAVVARFLNEAKSSARLNHENIAQVYLFGNVAGIPYIAFEYVEGVNLRDYVHNNGVLELSEAIDYILQTASALAHAASHGVTHRDVKPSNILVTPQKRVKLIDMGLARLLRSTDADGDLTESGVTLGTFDYISPEQAKDPRLADVRSDVYSLGCTFYYILAGTPPFPNGTVLQKLLQHQGDEAPDIREINPSVPPAIVSVIRKMMRKNPDERYQTPDLLIRDLLQIVDMLGLNVADRGYVDAEAVEKSRTAIPLMALPAIGAVVLLCAFAAAFYFFDSHSDLALPVVVPSPVAISPTTSEEGNLNSGDEPGPASSADALAATGKSSADVEQTDVVEIDKPTASRVYSGVEYTPADFDAIYASAFSPSVDKTSSNFVDEIRNELNISNDLRSYLTCSETVAGARRAAFGWRAVSMNVSTGESAAADVDASSDFCAVNLGTELLQDTDAVARSVSAYSTLGAVRQLSSAAEKPTDVIRVVDGRGEAPNVFATIAAALSVPARDADSVIHIELRGVDELETSPLSLVDKKVEIVAADGKRPTLVFKPSETPDGGWGERMFLLDSSTLLLRGVNIDFTVPSQEVVSSEWSVFEALGASELKLVDSTLTVCNMTGSAFTAPLHSNVAFIRSSDDSLFNPVFDPQASVAYQGESVPGFNASLENVLARGEATLFVIKKSGGRYEVKNSGFNVSGPFLQYVENDSAASRGGNRFTLEFEHIVAVGRSCLVRLDSEATMSAASVSFAGLVEKRSATEEVGADLQYSPTSALPPFDVQGRGSVICLADQPLALVTSPAVVNQEVFKSEWKLDRILTLDVSSFWRRRTVRSDTWQDFIFVSDDFNSESSTLAKLNVDAHERLENIPPHLFSVYDFSNWILSPIRTDSDLNAKTKEVGEEINANFLERFFE